MSENNVQVGHRAMRTLERGGKDLQENGDHTLASTIPSTMLFIWACSFFPPFFFWLFFVRVSVYCFGCLSVYTVFAYFWHGTFAHFPSIFERTETDVDRVIQTLTFFFREVEKPIIYI